MRVLLVEPEYYTRYPPLGLLKLSSYYKHQGDEVEFHRGNKPAWRAPHRVLITSLFTYSWAPVHSAVEYYRDLYPRAKIILGGIYATLMPEHAALAGAGVHAGLFMDAERYVPDYTLVPDWDSSIMFGTRGCVRKCAFCAVPRLEGKTWGPAQGIRDLVWPGHKKAVLWDNNILAVPNWKDVVAELKELDVDVDFNQGLDARFVTDEVAQELAGLKLYPIRMAYDIPNERKALERAIPALEQAGFRRRNIMVYTLFNFMDTPEDFLQRVINLLSWGVVSYPMRYEPLNSLVKNKYVSPHWTAEQLELVARARRVMGYGGAFPPYTALLEKFRKASSFEEAFSVRQGNEKKRPFPKGVAGQVEEATPGLLNDRAAFRELLNDPSTLQHSARCQACGQRIRKNDRAFPVQDYAGKYVEYICPLCHPNRKWINGLWRSVLGEGFSANGRKPLSLPEGVLSRSVH